jgi:hypothetical protein
MILAFLAQLGCASGAREVARTSIDEFGTEKNWSKLREPARALAGAVTAGTMEAVGATLQDGEMEARLDEYASRFTRAIAQQVNTELGPAVAQQVRSSVAAALDELTTEQRQEGLSQLMNRITAAAIAGLGQSLRQQLALTDILKRQIGPALAHTMTNDVGPAAQHILEQDLGPGLANMLRGEFGQAVTQSVGNSAEAAGQRFAAGARQELSPTIDHFFDRLQGAMEEGQQSAKSIFQVIIAIVLALSAGILGVLLLFRHREARARYNALHLVVREIRKMSQQDPSILALVTRIKKEGESHEGGDPLAAFLRQNPALKVKAEANLPPTPLARASGGH